VTTQAAPILRLDQVQVKVGNGATIIDAVDLSLSPGEIACLVGESGSGKTTTALTVFGYTASGLQMSAGQIYIDETPVSGERQFVKVRGQKVAYVPQNPGTALNPSMRIGNAILDPIRGTSPDTAKANEQVLQLLGRVGLPPSVDFARRFPHQLSGGQQQRVCIAIALASHPEVVVLDEPTTGLDVVTQSRILRELLRLRDEEGVAMLYVTHDLAVAAEIADRIIVMYGGYVVEDGPARRVLKRPHHPYTRGLMASTPDHAIARALEVMPGGPVDITARPSGCPFSPRCASKVLACESDFPVLLEVVPGHKVRCPQWQATDPIDWGAGPGAERVKSSDKSLVILDVADLKAEHVSRSGNVVAASGISFSLGRGECLALVGESGSGKTTIARAIAGLHPTWTGQLLLAGEPLAASARKRSREQRRRVQIVFQSPTDALNPRHTVGEALARPARMLRGLSAKAAEQEVGVLLDAVRMPDTYAHRYPRELSGGQRQRVAIARALAAEPDVIVCDEVTSALDVSVQARILDLLLDLRRDRGLALLFITHDLGVVATVADRVLVLEKGLICETGTTESVLSSPQHDYTKQLMRAAPSLSVAIHDWESRQQQPEF
jgi:peptide/nickel transport system ATP-binding protein